MANPTPTIAVNPLSGTKIKNGYIVTSVLRTGKFEDRAPLYADANVPSIGAYSALLDSRLIASGETYVATQ